MTNCLQDKPWLKSVAKKSDKRFFPSIVFNILYRFKNCLRGNSVEINIYRKVRGEIGRPLPTAAAANLIGYQRVKSPYEPQEIPLKSC